VLRQAPAAPAPGLHVPALAVLTDRAAPAAATARHARETAADRLDNSEASTGEAVNTAASSAVNDAEKLVASIDQQIVIKAEEEGVASDVAGTAGISTKGAPTGPVRAAAEATKVHALVLMFMLTLIGNGPLSGMLHSCNAVAVKQCAIAIAH
jgi:hypothetical protein